MNKTKIRILEQEYDVEIVERSYATEKDAEGAFVYMDFLAIDCGGMIQIQVESEYPPAYLLRHGEWVQGKIIGVPLPPKFKIMFLKVKKEKQEG